MDKKNPKTTAVREPAHKIDWSQPILDFEDVRLFMRYTVESFKKWCRKHRDFCQVLGDGTFAIHRDGFIAWFNSGRQDDVANE
jgi:hypothetical protein